MMLQYFEVKDQYRDCILFYRLGDFYEMFFDDALTASKELELTLTGRDCGMEERAPMCGVPHHSSDGYVAKLIAKGYKVAICEQVENPAEAVGIVKREVIRVVTPSTIINEGSVESSKNNFLASIYKCGSKVGLAFLDFSTGEMYATVIDKDVIQNVSIELSRFMPSEAIVNQDAENDKDIIKTLTGLECYITKEKYEYFDNADKTNKNQFGEKCSLDIGEISYFAIAGAIKYILNTQKTDISHINEVSYYSIGEYMDVDISTKRNLELTQTMRNKSKKGSLLWVMDETKTAMGGRRLRKWIDTPLVNCAVISKRLSGVEEMLGNIVKRSNLGKMLKSILDIERLISKIVCKSANARDIISLKSSIKELPALSLELSNCKSEMLQQLYGQIDKLEDICNLIEMSIVDEPPVSIRDGGIVKSGYSEKLDKYHEALWEGKTWIANIEATEREKTGIKNLKVGFNKVFGYFIEITKSNIDKAPDRYIRKQTLTNCERYITEDLKKIEETILGAEEKSVSLEYMIFEDIRDKIASEQEKVQETARAIGTLDCIISLAEVAAKYNYCKPIVDLSGVIDIKQGRHPVVERLTDELFVPNDTFLTKDKDRFSIITGPNMAGKSTYMRQVAVITLMAQMGSYVPAASARIGVVDSIFTRVGASDDLAAGQSTFMVEMSEVATILKNATSNSLIIYDEIGRGTSTYDGLAIAWAVAEFTSNKKSCGAKTLFATHYHELISLENLSDGIKNYSVAIKKRGEDIVFLRKIIRGGADDSFGVEVAKLAGIPDKVIKRAREMLKKFEEEKEQILPKVEKIQQVNNAISFEDNILRNIADEIKKINLDTLTPIEGMNLLYKLKKEIDMI